MKQELSFYIKDAFFELLKAGLWGDVPDPAFFEPLGEKGWNELYRLVKVQAVTGVCFSSLEQLPPEVCPPRKLYLSWFAQAECIRQNNVKMRNTYIGLNVRFEQAGICPVLMKGLGVASYYPVPDLRMTGDIDLYIPEKYEEAVGLVESWGYEVTYMPQHDKFQYNGFWIELHHSLINPSVSFDVPDKTAYVADDTTRYLIPDKEANALLLLTHAAKHLYGMGVGFRHLCDWTLFLKYNDAEIDFDYVWDRIRKTRLERFVVEFTALAVDCLGLDISIAERWMNGSQEKFKKRLSEDMLSNGDCGVQEFRKREEIDSAGSLFEKVGGWFGYYGAILLRQFLFYPYWPAYVRDNLGGRVRKRLKFVLAGRPLASK